MHRIRTASTVAAVHAQLTGSDVRARLLQSAQRRRNLLRPDEGAQTAEYAMLGGVGAAACGALIIILREDDGPLQQVLEAVVGGLLRAIRSWW